MWIPRTVLYPNAEAHSGPSQAFKTVIFQRTANDFKSTSLIIFFYKTFHYRCLKGSWTNWMFLNPWLDKWISTLSKYERCPVFTIQFGIRSYVLPIWIKLWRPRCFFHFYKKTCSRPKNCPSIRGFVCPSAPNRHYPHNWFQPVHPYLKDWNMIR